MSKPSQTFAAMAMQVHSHRGVKFNFYIIRTHKQKNSAANTEYTTGEKILRLCAHSKNHINIPIPTLLAADLWQFSIPPRQ